MGSESLFQYINVYANAHSFLQHIPDDIHKLVFEKTDKYAKEKYGYNYRSKKNYSHYKAKYDIYLKK